MQTTERPKATIISYSRFGGPEVLRPAQTDIPDPGPGQVCVRVRAAAINPIDVKIRRGDFAAVFPVNFPVTPGLDAAGTVDTIGAGVVDMAVGDDVLGIASTGSYAQFALLATPVIKLPSISWEVAASLPTVGEAAFRALKHLDLAKGETLLIHGAGGSVGAVATQLAVARGIRVIGSVGASDFDFMSALGAQAVRYGDGLTEEVRAISPRGVDAVLDAAGGGLLPVSIELAGSANRVITLVDESATKYGVRFTGADPSDRAPEALAQLVPLAASGKLTIKIWRTYPLVEAATAHADIEAGRNRGKIVLLP